MRLIILSILFSLTDPILADHPIMDTTPYLYLDFREPQGATTFRDLSGNDNDGTCTSCPDMHMGAFDGYADFVGTNSDRIDLPAGILSSDVGTVSMWLQTTGAGMSMLFYGTESNGNGLGGQDEIHTYIVTGEFAFFIEGASEIRMDAGSTINDGEIHHVVATWNSAGNATTYIDGNQDQQVAHNATTTMTGSSNVILGRPDSNQRYYTGRMYNVIAWDVELSARQVRNMYQIERWRFHPLRPALEVSFGKNLFSWVFGVL